MIFMITQHFTAYLLLEHYEGPKYHIIQYVEEEKEKGKREATWKKKGTKQRPDSGIVTYIVGLERFGRGDSNSECRPADSERKVLVL
jgi:hypothetical protein